MTRPRASTPTEVTIVSNNPETLDSLQTYLRGAGVGARSARELEPCAVTASGATLAIVVFADDFRWESVVTTLADLALNAPQALPVLVTAHPQRFERLTLSGSVLIVPRPVWGWTILEAIRAHAAHRSLERENRPSCGNVTRRPNVT